ncbi:MAG: preprotein translocase subunit SecA, partial [Actinomycetota bacterium]|nr:preprotein translocase subunit SecA [Actinomycetota bacterium]
MLDRLLRLGEGRMVKRLKGVADFVNTLSDDVAKLSDAELRAKTDEFKKRVTDGAGLDDLLPEAFAVAREASWRVLGQRHFDVQVMGGAALHFGNVAEMKTGEGKTLTAVLPAYLNALGGEGVHIVTVNDYLAKRDAEWMGRVHRFLGLNVGVILSGLTPDERRVAYAADITYGTNNEFGFDYLRDNMAHSLADLVQRGHNFAIVDEVDSILIDEARTPLIISGPADGASNWYTEFARLAPLMEKDVHYEVDIRKRTVGVHELGVEFVEDQLGIDNLYEAANSPLVSYLNNAIKAKELFQRDKDYIVRDGDVVIVDEFTGRVLTGRRYNEGMHQAIEAKEHVEIKAENQTLATITLQNYFRLYETLSGMTGTAQTEAAELHEIYKLGVVSIPTNKPMVRADRSDLIYKTEEAKYIAVVDDVAERYEKGQPVLIGTTSVERSEYLSRQFQKRRIPHNVLNAKYHEQEASIIAEAGRLGAVTVATNMAGRGTDIVLGGNPDFLTDKRLRERGLDPVETPEDYEKAWHEMLPEVKAECAQEAEDVIASGGLYVLGTERHESRRIDNQLRGRSGRQGDPGESRFYLSLGDELMRRFNGATLESLLTRLNLPDDVPIEAKMVTRAIKSAQTQVEEQNFEVRKNVLKYDEVMNQQRVVIYDERRRILEGENLAEQAHKMLVDVITAYVDGATAEGYSEDWDLEQLWTALRQLYPVGIDHHDLLDSDAVGEPGELTREELFDALIADAERAYAEREKQLEEIAGEGAMRQLERNVLLNVLDRKWREHLYEMDYLKEGIGLRAMAQRDPLVEYQREGYDMFIGMLEGLKEESVGFLFNVSVEPAPQPTVAPVAT